MTPIIYVKYNIKKGRTFLNGLTSLKRRLHPLVTHLPRFEKPLRGCWYLNVDRLAFALTF